MPRTNAAGELWRKPTSFRIIREATGTHGDTTTTAAITGAGNELTVAVAASTNFTSGDPVLTIGDGGVESLVIGTPALSMPVTPPPKVPQSTGARFVEAVELNCGKIVKDSLKLSGSKSIQAIFEELADSPVVYFPGDAEFVFDFALYGINGLNMQMVMGYLEAETGDGLARATAYQVVMGLAGQTLHGETVARIKGVRFDGKNIEFDLLNAFFEAAVNSSLGRGAPAQLNGRLKGSALLVRQYT